MKRLEAFLTKSDNKGFSVEVPLKFRHQLITLFCCQWAESASVCLSSTVLCEIVSVGGGDDGTVLILIQLWLSNSMLIYSTVQYLDFFVLFWQPNPCRCLTNIVSVLTLFFREHSIKISWLDRDTMTSYGNRWFVLFCHWHIQYMYIHCGTNVQWIGLLMLFAPLLNCSNSSMRRVFGNRRSRFKNRKQCEEVLKTPSHNNKNKIKRFPLTNSFTDWYNIIVINQMVSTS